MQDNFLRIKAGLARQGVTQQQVADDLGVSRMAVYQVMRGAMRSSRIQSALIGVIGFDPWQVESGDGRRATG